MSRKRKVLQSEQEKKRSEKRAGVLCPSKFPSFSAPHQRNQEWVPRICTTRYIPAQTERHNSRTIRLNCSPLIRPARPSRRDGSSRRRRGAPGGRDRMHRGGCCCCARISTTAGPLRPVTSCSTTPLSRSVALLGETVRLSCLPFWSAHNATWRGLWARRGLAQWRDAEARGPREENVGEEG